MTGGFIGGIIVLVIILVMTLRGAAAARERKQVRERLRLEVDPQLSYFFARDAAHKVHVLELQIPHASPLPEGWQLYGLEEDLVKIYKRPSSLLSVTRVSMTTPAQLVMNGAHIVGGLEEIFDAVLPGYVEQLRGHAAAHGVRWVGVALDEKHLGWRWQAAEKPSLEATAALVRTCHQALVHTDKRASAAEVCRHILAWELGATTAARMAARALLREPIEALPRELVEHVRQLLTRWPLWGLTDLTREDARLLDLMDDGSWHAALTYTMHRADDHVAPSAEHLGQLLVMLLGRAPAGEARERMSATIARHTLTRLPDWYDLASLRKLSKGIGADPEDNARVVAALLLALDALIWPPARSPTPHIRTSAQANFEAIHALLDLLTRHGDAQAMRWLADADRRLVADDQAPELRAELQGTIEQLHKRGKWRDDPTAGALFLAAEPQDQGALTLADDPRGALTEADRVEGDAPTRS